jgi:hypothetical protein
MKQFMIYLTVSIGLLILWLITGLYAGYLGPTYFQVAAVWHIALHILWFIVTWVAGAYGLLWYWQRRSRPPARPTHQHPYQAQKNG